MKPVTVEWRCEYTGNRERKAFLVVYFVFDFTNHVGVLFVANRANFLRDEFFLW